MGYGGEKWNMLIGLEKVRGYFRDCYCSSSKKVFICQWTVRFVFKNDLDRFQFLNPIGVGQAYN